MQQFNTSEDLSDHINYHRRWLQERQHNAYSTNQKGTESRSASPKDRNKTITESPKQTQRNTTYFSTDPFEESYDGLKPINDIVPQTALDGIDENPLYQYQSYYDDEKAPPRWETLYQLNKKNLQIKDKLAKEAYDRELNSECTFQPKLNSPFNFQRYEYSLPLHERNKIWKHDKEERLAIIRDEKAVRSMKECTFHPNLNHHRTTTPVVRDISPYQFRGIDVYLNRQFTARKNKEEIDYMFETSFSKSPKSTTVGDSKITTPREPSLQTSFRAIEYSKRKEKSPSGTSKSKSPHRSINLAHTNALAQSHAGYRLYDALETGNDYGREKDKGFAKAIESLHNELHRLDLNY